MDSLCKGKSDECDDNGGQSEGGSESYNEEDEGA